MVWRGSTKVALGVNKEFAIAWFCTTTALDTTALPRLGSGEPNDATGNKAYA